MDMQQLNDKINAWLNSFVNSIENLSKMPKDEMAAWGAIVLGCFFVIAAVIMW